MTGTVSIIRVLTGPVERNSSRAPTAIHTNLKPLGTDEAQRLRAWLSSMFPGRCPTRGGDLAYTWAAWETNQPLETWDGGIHQFRSPGPDVYYPSDLLAVWQTAIESTG